MTKTTINRYDVAEHLRSTEEMAACRKLPEIQGFPVKAFIRSLDGEHIPNFDTILKVTKALGIHLHADPA